MIGVDLGTTNVRIYVKGKGVLLREPAVIAVSEGSGEVKAVGRGAYDMLGRTPGKLSAVTPMANGVIADYTLTERMLKTFLGEVVSGARRFFRPIIMVGIPSGVTEVERRAVVQAVSEVGARRVHLIEAPLAGAIGAGIDIAQPLGSMTIDLGGGTTDIALISLGGLVTSESLAIGGNSFDTAIAQLVKSRYELVIGKRTAEEIKCAVGAADLYLQGDNRGIKVRGQDLITGTPKSASITTEDVVAAISQDLEHIAAAVRKVLENAPPELVADVIERGVILTGGGARLRNLERFLSEITDIPVATAEDPEDCVVRGTAKALEMAEFLRDERRKPRRF